MKTISVACFLLLVICFVQQSMCWNGNWWQGQHYGLNNDLINYGMNHGGSDYGFQYYRKRRDIGRGDRHKRQYNYWNGQPFGLSQGRIDYAAANGGNDYGYGGW